MRRTAVFTGLLLLALAFTLISRDTDPRLRKATRSGERNAENMLELTFGEPIAIEEKATWLRGRRHRRQGS